MQRPRVIATDFDGTLLRSDLTLSERTRAALRAAETAGIEVVVVTARPPRWMDGYADAIGAHGTVLCGNGAFVYDVAARRVIEVHALDADLLARVVDRLRAAVPGIAFAAETAHGMVRERAFTPDPHVADLPRAVAAVVERIEDGPHPCGKLLARCPAMAPADFHGAAADAVGEDAVLAYSGAVGLAEITAPGVTKAVALQAFCSRRDIDAQDVWAFGDMPNDIPMLAWAGRGYCVRGGHPDAVTAAGYTCPGNDEDGVANVIESLL